MKSTAPRTLRPIVGRIHLGIVTSLILAVVAGACGGTATQASSAPTPAPISSASLGQNLYTSYCARCHGASLEGKDGNPAIDAVRLASMGDQRLRLTIESGKGQMPGFRFSATETDALLAYLSQPT